ncbi:MAG TPA: hypothetical protein VN864_04795 [Thermoplasmata archaeon]|nr:hypothetical protein [Thermoplasmata archaeon]
MTGTEPASSGDRAGDVDPTVTPEWRIRLRAFRSLATLRETRALVRGWPRRLALAAVATVVVVASLFVGGMLTLLPTQGVYVVEVIWWGPPSTWWFYPEVLVIQPWGLLQLPLLPTVTMVLVALGAGLGAVAGIGLARDIVRRPRGTTSVSAGTAVVAGSGPGIASLATLGACCCSTCASTGGLALVAAASGTSVASLITTQWYLPIFQPAIVYLILLAQERALRRSREISESSPPVDLRFVAGSVLRVGLLVGGITWSLAMLVEWGSENPLTAPPATWYHWLFEHQVLSLLAVTAGLFPRELSDLLRRAGRTAAGRAGRLGFGLAGVTWGIWVPPALVGLGLGGFLNELFGALGMPGAWAPVPPDSVGVAPLAFHWAFQHLLLSAFAIAVALRPEWATRPLEWTLGRIAPGRSSPSTVPGGRAYPTGEGVPGVSAASTPPSPD